ncbi:MAG: rod shape-determining protein MreC [Rhodocyclaceae bacterium]|nr:rod shape-determining protein MreC [Rhodocyclaceae bacterium]
MSSSSHQTPPFFKRGPAPLVRLVFFVALSLSLLFVDLRFRYLEVLRQAIAVMTYPLQRMAYGPVAAASSLGDYFTSIGTLRGENTRLQRREIEATTVSLRQEQLDRENQQLRLLLDMKQRQPVKGVVAEIQYNVRDPFSHKVIINKGSQQDILLGEAVVDEQGVIGQVTRVYPFQSEVTLISNKDQGVPVRIVRNGLRSVVFGSGDGQLELRFMATNADVKEGDILETSGLDGIYVPGLPVAKVSSVRRDVAYSFARILCTPLGGVDRNDLVLVLSPREQLPPPAVDAEKVDKPGKGRRARK